MNISQKNLKKAAEKIAEKIERNTDEDLAKMSQQYNRAVKQPKDVLGLTDPVVEGIYAQAYRLYGTGKYKDALQLFRLLVSLSPTEGKFILGMGACFHLMKEYKDAVETYAICAAVDPENPVPFYHMADCLVQMNDPMSAKATLEMAIKTAGTKPEFATLKDRAELTLGSLTIQISELTNPKK